MSILKFYVLSVWEIAHRWHNIDPNITDEKALPLSVQDTLRYLTRLMARHDLRSSTSTGTEFWTDADRDSFETFSDYDHLEDNLKNAEPNSGELWEAYEKYLDHCDGKIRRHRENIEDFDKCFNDRIFDKNLLDDVYTTREALKETLDEQNSYGSHKISPPEFWYPASENKIDDKNIETGAKRKKLRDNQADKLLVQTIARAIWAEDPEITITALTKHKGIRQHGNGAIYTIKTLHNWIAEVDPRDSKEKIGRRKTKSKPEESDT